MHLDGHRARAWADQPHDGLLSLKHVHVPFLCCTSAQALLFVVGHQCITDELNALLQCHRRVPTGIPGSQRENTLHVKLSIKVSHVAMYHIQINMGFIPQ